MKKKKIILGLLLATAFVGLASCGGKSNKNDGSNSGNNNNQQQTEETKKEYDYQAISSNFGTLTNKDDSNEKYYKFDDVVFTLDITTQPTVTADGQITVKKYKLEDETKGYEQDGETKTYSLPKLTHGSYYSYSSTEIYYNDDESLVPSINQVVNDATKAAALATALVDNKIMSVEFTDYSTIEDNICYQLKVYDKEQEKYIYDEEVNASVGFNLSVDTVDTLEGYSNIGFAASATSSAVAYNFDQNYTLTGDLEIFVLRQKLKKVTFDFNGYNHDAEIDYADKNNKFVIPDLSSTLNQYTDHIFKGWSLSKTDTSTLYAAGDEITLTENSTLYAIYEEIDHATLDYNGHVSGGSYETYLEADSENKVTLPMISSTDVENGYFFLGWSTDKDATTAEFVGGTTVTLDANTTYYAVFEPAKKIQLDYNGYDHSTENYFASRIGEFVIPDLTSTLNQYTDYVFKGWSLSKTDTSVLYNVGDTITLEEDTTLYAIFDEIYTATFNYRGHVIGDTYPSSKKGDSLNNVTLPFVYSTYVQSGYSFLGWSTDPNATTAEYEGNRTLKLTGSTTFYAVFKVVPIITYDFNGLDQAQVTNTTTDSGYITIMVNEPEWADHTFVGWSKTKTSTTAEYKPGDYVQFESNTTLYAIWTVQPILRFDANGGVTTSVPKPMYPTDGKVTIPDTTPGRGNYRFLGWSTNKNATEPSYSAGDEINVTSAITLYAIWQQTVTVYVNPDNNRRNYATKNVYDVGKTITLNYNYTKSNYTFKGWSITGVDGIKPYGYELKLTESMTSVFITAEWIGNDLTIVFEKNMPANVVSGNVSNIKTRFGETFVIPDGSAYTSENYEFIGWHWGEFYQNINNMPKDISIDFAVGDVIYVDDYHANVYPEGTYMFICAVFREKGHTYETTVTEPTLESNGKTVYTCIDDDTYSYVQPITNSNLFAGYVSKVEMVPGRGLGLTTTIMSGTINLLDKISVVLKDGTVANDIVVDRIWVNDKYVETASRGTEAVIFVRYNGTPVQLDTVGIGCVICANGQAIPNVQSIYVKVRLLSENEGGRVSPFTINYQPRIKVGTFTSYTTISAAYNVRSYQQLADNTLFWPDNSFVFKLESSSFLNAWIGEKIQFIDGSQVIAEGEIIARTDNQAADYFENNITVYLYEDGGTPYVINVKKGTRLNDIDCPFFKDGYEFLAWTLGGGVEVLDPSDPTYDEELKELIIMEAEETVINESGSYAPAWIKIIE